MDVRDIDSDPIQLHELHTTAKKLAVSIDTVRRLIRNGDLIAVDVGAGQRASYRIDEAEIRRFVKAREILAEITEQAAIAEEAASDEEASPPREGTPRNSEASDGESA